MKFCRLGAASLALSALTFAGSAHALSITTTNDATTLGNAILGGGSAILVNSVTYSGAAIASGTYTDGPLGMADGALLTSGSAQNALPPNNSGSTSQANGLSGHALCNALIPGYTSYDATLLTINFDLAEDFDGISFNSVFGSEEYPEYVSSSFNDVYGVYLNGVQVAFDDNGNPITINGPFFSGGSVVFPPANGTEYDGTTGILHTKAPLAGGTTGNVLQIVICDGGDQVYDSGAFLSGLNGCVGEDCSGTVPCSVIDDDTDGFNACDDCDDANPSTNPGAPEVCDFVDNDCDAEVDEGDVCTPVCVTIQRGTYGDVEDSPIQANSPNYNYGAYPSLYTGWKSDGGAKMSLIRFDLAVIPDGATVTSSTLGVYQTYSTTGSTVNVHQATMPWSESTVTWNNFGTSYDPAVLGSFSSFVNGFGFKTVDVTGMVGAWVDGTVENDGFLLEEALTVQHAYRSSETATVTDRPYLEVCYYGGSTGW
jgi:hypothetical protein